MASVTHDCRSNVVCAVYNGGDAEREEQCSGSDISERIQSRIGSAVHGQSTAGALYVQSAMDLAGRVSSLHEGGDKRNSPGSDAMCGRVDGIDGDICGPVTIGSGDSEPIIAENLDVLYSCQYLELA